MIRLEDIRKDNLISGIEASGPVRIMAVDASGDNAVSVVYKNQAGTLGERMLFRPDEANLSLAEDKRPWQFDAPGGAFKLGVEALRIHLAHLFDPMMAIHTSNVIPLPHQITAVYESMLPRQPLRFVLADDPGAGKTVMAGLYIRELMMRSDAQRILIIAPGSLVEQWQDELFEKFGLVFDLFTREMMDNSHSGNPFRDRNFLIARLDQLSRADDIKEKLKLVEWDLVVVDEAHKMSASYFGNKVKYTKRHQLGQMLSSKGRSRHFLLMTATPHNGKEEDFQLFLTLLDSDRFLGKFRDGVHKVDTSDVMRRMVKEDLVKFDGKRLFPERHAFTAKYELSELEKVLYEAVTEYVKNEMNKADKMGGKKKNTIGFALTILQRRLASSPEAIYQSLKRRREKLEKRIEDVKNESMGNSVAETMAEYGNNDPYYDFDEDDFTGTEYEKMSEELVDQATASQTIEELQAEIEILNHLEQQAKEVVVSGQDRKWEELSKILQDDPLMRDRTGARKKLIIFTEHRDTLNYLLERVRGVFGDQKAVVAIHGSIHRDKRREVQEIFLNDPDTLVLVATDAAGEGVNLQNASLMVNYDLPWNPNRIEQRFGRIHRIGQTEVCNLWNMVAIGTREGLVFDRLFDKLNVERNALGGRVFDILGDAFENKSLKEMLIDAIRYGDDPEVREKLDRQVEGALDTEHLKDIIARNALSEEVMTPERLYAVKEEMEKAEARRLQPRFIRAFFMEAFANLHGILRKRETGRYEITHVPGAIRERDKIINHTRNPVIDKYERVCFEQEQIRIYGKPMAALVHPAHPLMAAVTDIILSNYRNLLKQGAVLYDSANPGMEPRLLVLLDHSVREAVYGKDERQIASRRIQFVYIRQDGSVSNAGWAPHLDLEPLADADLSLVKDILQSPWISENVEKMAFAFANEKMVPEHFNEIKKRRESEITKIKNAVHDRLTKEIDFWQDQYLRMKDAVEAGKQPQLQPDNAKRRVEDLRARLDIRTKELETKQDLIPSPPVVVGAALVIPRGLLDYRKGTGEAPDKISKDAQRRSEIEQLAMQAVINHEHKNGYTTKDVSADKCGWDISSYKKGCPDRHIEVKGRIKGADTITVTRNEIMYAMNQAEKFVLAIVLVNDDNTHEGPHYIRSPFSVEPDWCVSSLNYKLSDLLSKVEPA